MHFFNLDRASVVAFDTETTGLGKIDRAFGVSVAVDGLSGYWDIREHPGVLEWLREASRDSRKIFVAHNTSFDYKMLCSAGLELPLDILDDTVIRACLIDENLNSYSLDDLAKKYLKQSKTVEIYDQLASLFGGKATRNVQMANISRAPSHIVAPYAIRDAELTLRLWRWQQTEIKRQGIEQIVEFERRVMPSLIRMEMHGIRVNVDAAVRACESIAVEIDKLQREIDSLNGGKPFNVNSTPQVRAMFSPKKSEGEWVADNGTILPLTESGAPSISSEVLREMEGDRRAELILGIRSLIKTKGTFLEGHVIGSAVDGRVYPTINQVRGEESGTRTGRLSYTSPAMQQIPSRNKKVAQVVKPVFLPDDGQLWLDADLASNEVRVFAHLVNNPKINALYAQDINTDFHQAVADMTGLPRNASYSGQANSKQLNLSMIFNSGNGSIAQKIGLPWEWSSFVNDDGEEVRYRKAGPEAMEIIENYHKRLPGVRELAEKASMIAKGRGYIKTKYGRRLRFPDKRFAYKASGLLIQATAADINKQLIYRLESICRQNGGALLLNTHDSYSISVPEESINQVWDSTVKCLVDDFPWLNVPLMLELSGVGKTWWGALNNENNVSLN